MPWISRAEYDCLLAAIDNAERRAAGAESALAAERAANRESERHWADMFLRRMQTFPLPKKSPAATTPVEANPALVPVAEIAGMDEGELEALVATGAAYGVSRADVIRELRRERGLE